MKLVDRWPPYQLGPMLFAWRVEHAVLARELADVWDIHDDALAAIERRRSPPPSFAGGNYERLARFMSSHDEVAVSENLKTIEALRDSDRKIWERLPNDFYDFLRMRGDEGIRR